MTRRPDESEQSNERRVVNWLGTIAVAALIAVTYLAATATRNAVGIDTAVIVALIGVIAQCASSIGTRRTRGGSTPDDGQPGDPTQPPPWTGGTP